jgi:hypothetical protein
VVRVTPWHAADVVAVAAHPASTLMLPMARCPAELEALTPHPVIALYRHRAGRDRLRRAGGAPDRHRRELRRVMRAATA